MNALNEVSQIHPGEAPSESQQSEASVKLPARRRRMTRCAPYYVYVIEDHGARAVKIGIARDAYSRACELQVGNPRHLRVFQFFEVTSSSDARDIELRAHRELAHRRLVGEWFEVAASTACDAIRSAAPFPMTCKPCLAPPTVSPGYPEPAAGLILLASPLVKTAEGVGV